MKVIGITGGVGCGKSLVMEEFAKTYPAWIIKADDVAKELMKKNGTAWTKIRDVFGKAILTDDGEIDRKQLAGIVFHNKNKLMVLNSIVHPSVKKKIMEDVTKYRIEDSRKYCLVEAALLIEDHYEVICDEFWYIYSDEAVRRERLKSSRGYSDEKIDSMLKNQLSEEKFRQACRYTIDNSKSMTDTMEQIKKILED